MDYTNAIVVGWDRAIPGRELDTAKHFGEYLGYLSELSSSDMIESFEPVFINAYGGVFNGFFLIRGRAEKLAELKRSETWISHVVRATVNMEGFCVLGAGTGSAIEGRMQLYTKWSAAVA